MGAWTTSVRLPRPKRWPSIDISATVTADSAASRLAAAFLGRHRRNLGVHAERRFQRQHAVTHERRLQRFEISALEPRVIRFQHVRRNLTEVVGHDRRRENRVDEQQRRVGGGRKQPVTRRGRRHHARQRFEEGADEHAREGMRLRRQRGAGARGGNVCGSR